MQFAVNRLIQSVLLSDKSASDSMVHDAGWRYLDIGRRIERAVNLAELTRALFVEHHDREVEQTLLESFLVANESSVIYRRRNRGLYQLDAGSTRAIYRVWTIQTAPPQTHHQAVLVAETRTVVRGNHIESAVDQLDAQGIRNGLHREF